MADQLPAGYFNRKVLVMMLITCTVLGALAAMIIKFMAKWEYMPVFLGLVVATGLVAEAYRVNERNWYRD